MLATIVLPEIKPAPIEEWCDLDGVHLKLVCPIRGCGSECHILYDDAHYADLTERWRAGESDSLIGVRRQMSEKYWQHMGQEH